MKKLLVVFVAILFLSSTQPVSAQSSFALARGWNLVSSNVIFGLNLENLIKSGGGLFLLNPNDKQYYGGNGDYKNVVNSIESTQASLKYGDNVSALGWWVYTKIDMSPSVNLSIPEDRVDYYKESYSLIQGWNFVGITSIMLDKSLADI